ncbi:MAG: transcription termination factor Rho [Lachnospiraceae bacterium]|nr:transcription termination factor Rho [Lachnospiraceae bacterium]
MDYSHMTVSDLRKIAKDKGVAKAASLKKQELIDALIALETEAAKTETVKAAEVEKAVEETAAIEEPKTIESSVEESDSSEETEKGTENSENVEKADEEEKTEGESTASPEQNQRRQENGAVFNRGDTKEGILEIMPDGYGFIRSDNFLPGDADVYVSPQQIRKFNLRTGDIIVGITKQKTPTEKFNAMLYCKTVNGNHPYDSVRRPRFENLTPVFPHDRLRLETPGCSPAMRIMDILSPIGKGQRGMIVSQPKAGKTTLLKQIAKAICANNPEMHMIILLIDERPEEVTDMKESISGDNVEVIYSTFDELPENHKRVSEMVIERAKRLVEQKKDVVILLDSITRLARAYNLTCTASGRTLSGGLDPAALHMPKKFFGAARCMREGGSLTILATALVETGSRMDDVVFEEFKGTGNMELVLDRNLSEKRIFPAIDLPKSSTRRDDLLLDAEEAEVNDIIRHAFNSSRAENAVEKIISMFARTRNNREFCDIVKKTKLI